VDTADTIVAIVVGAATLYLQWKQNKIFEQQNRIFSEQAGKSKMKTEDVSRGIRFERYWPMAVMALMLILIWIAVGYGIYDHHRVKIVHFDQDEKLITIANRKFLNEIVPLDGFKYANCIFENVTFQYNGTALFGFEHNKVFGTASFRSDSDAVTATVSMFKGFGIIPNLNETYGGSERIPVPVEPPSHGPLAPTP